MWLTPSVEKNRSLGIPFTFGMLLDERRVETTTLSSVHNSFYCNESGGKNPHFLTCQCQYSSIHFICVLLSLYWKRYLYAIKAQMKSMCKFQMPIWYFVGCLEVGKKATSKWEQRRSFDLLHLCRQRICLCGCVRWIYFYCGSLDLKILMLYVFVSMSIAR